MKAVVIYESLTGRTRRAAEVVAGELVALGLEAVVLPIDKVELHLEALAEADVVVVGTWVSGHFVVGQKPGRAYRLEQLPALGGKKVAAFCTFALNPGKTLPKMIAILERRGGEVIGGMEIRRDDLQGGAGELAARLVVALDAPLPEAPALAETTVEAAPAAS